MRAKFIFNLLFLVLLIIPQTVFTQTPGTQKWAFTSGDEVWSSPAIASDGTIYVGSKDSKLYAINPDGTQKWAFLTGSNILSSPVIASDSIIYVGSEDDKLYAINLDGTQKWAFLTGSNVLSSPAVAADGTIYVGSYDNNFYAINPDGSQKWAFTTGDRVNSSPAIASDGMIYVGSQDTKLYAINPDGTQKWAFTTGDFVNSSPAIASDETIYVGSLDTKLYAINSDGMQKWAFTTGNWVYSSLAIATDGTIYAGSWDKKLYAIYDNNAGLAQSPWPKFHQNNQNTGSAMFIAVVDQIQFDFFRNGETVQKTFEVINPTSKSITVNSCVLDNAAFSLITALPVTIPAGSRVTLTLNIVPDNTRLYRSTCQLDYEVFGESKAYSSQISAGLFLDDDSELSYTAHRAMDAYIAAKATDPSSVATENNLGVLYRLLGAAVTAEKKLLNAVSRGLNASYGYGGIKMNIGIVKSDQGQTTDANEFYDVAMTDVSTGEDTSAIAPLIYYNKAWEAYTGDGLSEAMTLVNNTIASTKANDFLKAKAYVLRGAIQYRQGDETSARDDFQQAVTFDPDGPIGRMAQENLQMVTAVEDAEAGENIPSIFVLNPSYPNPFNPQTTISFGLPKGSEVELVIYNVLGQKVRTLFHGYFQTGWHNITWDGSDDAGSSMASGVYLLRMKADEFVSTHKMTLLR